MQQPKVIDADGHIYENHEEIEEYFEGKYRAACGAPEIKAFLLMVAAVFMPAFSLRAILSSLKPAKETARSSLVN